MGKYILEIHLLGCVMLLFVVLLLIVQYNAILVLNSEPAEILLWGDCKNKGMLENGSIKRVIKNCGIFEDHQVLEKLEILLAEIGRIAPI